MPERILVVARMVTVSNARRDEFLGRLQALADVALESEPGTLKYATFVPRQDDLKTVYVVEEYLDQPSFDLHMASAGVKETNEWLTNEQVLDPDNTPDIRVLEYLPNFRFTRAEVPEHPDPYVLFAEIDYLPGGADTSATYWKAVVETGRDHEPGTLMYGILKDTKQNDRLYSIEAYESKEYLENVHVPSKAIQISIANTKHLRKRLKHHVLQKKGGFLRREEQTV